MGIDSVLGPDGLIAHRLDDYESRPQQLEMATAVDACLRDSGRLLVEAGTGVGKSFAYLAPLIQRLAAQGKKAVVSTHTIQLQQQLVEKDIPLLQAVMPEEFSAVLAMGRGNYICLRRMNKALQRSGNLFDRRDLIQQLEDIRVWSETTTEGTLASLPQQPDPVVWSEVNAEQGNCLGKACPYYGKCHWQAARRRVMNANLVITNHSLLMADLSLRTAGSQLLPKYDYLVIDEAHCLEKTASEHLGFRITEGQVQYYFNRLWNPERGKGFLLPYFTEAIEKALERARRAASHCFDQMRRWFDLDAPSNKRVREPGIVDDDLCAALRGLYHAMAESADTIEDTGDRLEYQKHMDRALELSEHLQILNGQTAAGFVYWIEEVGRMKRLSWHGAPIDVSQILQTTLFDQVGAAVLTSATLTLGRDQSFEYVERQLGLREPARLSLGSPFDYEEQVQCHIPADMPAPDADGYESALQAAIDRYVTLSRGRAFVLFTSFSLMRRMHDRLAARFQAAGFPVLCQGENLSRQQMLQAFREHGNSVLFGVDSFWQGVDVPGDALSNVIITRLPFPVPSYPPVEARCEWIEQRGGNAFRDYSIPEAALKLKQGFGRLIRSRRDTGIVVILDSRILQRRYGRIFVDSLPRCSIITHAPAAAQD